MYLLPNTLSAFRHADFTLWLLYCYVIFRPSEGESPLMQTNAQLPDVLKATQCQL